MGIVPSRTRRQTVCRLLGQTGPDWPTRLPNAPPTIMGPLVDGRVVKSRMLGIT